MPRRRLTREWSIEIDDSFTGRIVDRNLQFVSLGPPVRTIWLAVWSPPPEQSANEIATWIQQEAVAAHQKLAPARIRYFDEPGTDPDEIRLASWYPDSVEGRFQWALYAYTVRPGSYVQASFIADDEDQLDWALTAWRSLRYSTPPPVN